MKKNKLIKTIWVVLFIVLGGYILYSFIFGGVEMVQTVLENGPNTKVLSNEYASLFNKDAYSKLVVDKVKHSKGRNEVALINIDSFRLVVCKIDVTDSMLFKDNVIVGKSTTHNSSDVVYQGVRERFFTFLYSNIKPLIAKRIFVILDGTTIDTIASNNSLINLYGSVRRASIRYEEDGKNDFYFTTDDNSFAPQTIPISMLFLKRGNAIYFLLMAPNFRQKNVPPQLLLSIVNSKEEK